MSRLASIAANLKLAKPELGPAIIVVAARSPHQLGKSTIASPMASCFDSTESTTLEGPLQEGDGAIPSVAKRRNIASIRFGGSFAPPSSHQVITAMNAP